jgi:hypothetical protein
MRILNVSRLLMALALMGMAGYALADASSTDGASETVVVLSEVTCKDVAPDLARALADKAWQDGAYKRAGECYVVAGQSALANEAFVKASAQSSGDTSRRLASNLNDVKTQARQMKQAFQRR